MTDRELLGSVAKHTGFKVLVYGAALILPSLIIWAGGGFIALNWSPTEWPQNLRALFVFLSISITFFAFGAAMDATKPENP